MSEENEEKNKEDQYSYPSKKYIDPKKDQYVKANLKIITNLTKLELNKEAINGIYLFGCDLSEETEPSEHFNPVNIMRKARKLKCFQDKIKEHVENYYISGLVLMGKPKNIKKKKFKFYLKADESQGYFDGEILDDVPEEPEGKIYKFKFKRKKEDLSKMQEDKNSGEALCVANYLNICLGKILKKCNYNKDRTSRKILYYKSEDVEKARALKSNPNFVFFPALKAVCETYEGGNIYMKLLPKTLVKTVYTYLDYFDIMKNEDLEERFKEFRQLILNRKAMTTYNQVMMKIEDVIFENPYDIEFTDKSGKKWNVGQYLSEKLVNYNIEDKKMPIAVRVIDKGGKLKDDDRKYIHIPCELLSVIGNPFSEKINIKDLIQNPTEKLGEIDEIRQLIEEKSIDAQKESNNNNYLGTKFDPVTIDGQIIEPPIIKFSQNIQKEVNEGKFDLRETVPYSKVQELNKIDIYTYDLEENKYRIIWEKLEGASKELGIKFQSLPTFYKLDIQNNENYLQSYIEEYFNKLDDYYKKKENKTDFIFLFMDKKYKERSHYRIFKSVINKYDWCIPTQVILYDEKKMNSSNLSQFTNILCQMWAKKGNELYICDFNFIPNTLVIAYSSTKSKENTILTSVSISIGAKLYEYMFFSESCTYDTESKNNNSVPPSLSSVLSKALKTLGKVMKKPFDNIVIYRDAVNEKQQRLIRDGEIPIIKKTIEDVIKKLDNDIFKNSKWILILVSKMNEIKLFLEGKDDGNNYEPVKNIPVGTLVDRVITHQEKYDFYLNSAESRQGTCSSTHYIVLHDNTDLTASQIYRLTYYLSFLSYNTTKSIRVPAPLYFVTRRNQFTIANLNGQIINPKSRVLNISL